MRNAVDIKRTRIIQYCELDKSPCMYCYSYEMLEIECSCRSEKRNWGSEALVKEQEVNWQEGN